MSERRSWQATDKMCGAPYPGGHWVSLPCIHEQGSCDEMHADWYGRTWSDETGEP